MKFFIFFSLSIQFPLAAVIENYSTETNDRFADSSLFIASDFDLSGIGRASNGRWATLIAPNIFVSANHYRPGVGREVTFFAENDPTGLSFSYQVAGLSRIAGSDLLIGHFDEMVDSSIAYYHWASETLENSASLLNQEVFQLSRSDEFGNLTDLTVGQNTISNLYADAAVPGLGAGDLLTTRYSALDEHALFHEARLASGDSGSPLLLPSGNELTVIGVATAMSSFNSFYTYTGTSTDEVQSYIQINGLGVPEPSSFFLLGLGLPFVWKRYR